MIPVLTKYKTTYVESVWSQSDNQVFAKNKYNSRY